MTQRASDPDDPVDLAAVDADLPDAARAAVLRRAARSDARSAEVLDALAATRSELGALPEPDVPPEAAARWEAALAAERDRSRPAGDAEQGSRRRRLRPRVVLTVSAAAAAAAAVVVLGARPAPPVLTVSRVDLVAVATSAVGVVDVGDLGDPARREACLRAVLPDAAGERLLGGRRVVLDGRPGVLLVLATGTRGQLRVVTVDPGCGPAGGTVLAQVTVA
ncbi:MAG: hypothetical protein JNM77_06345 [Pseudonocardia sp.]|nr:hypothetical protein [Pseudonocardia sp.]